jgi:hypothetical protein
MTAGTPPEWGGHSVLVVPVPDLDDVVRATTAEYDASFVSADPAFAHAHITLLGPWLPDPSSRDLDAVADIAVATEPFDFELAEVEQFPGGVIYLRPEPSHPFAALTAKLTAAFPRCVPYDGMFPEVVPHLTLDWASGSVDVDHVRSRLRGRVPHRARADRVDLQWWHNHDCHVRRSWGLGS